MATKTEDAIQALKTDLAVVKEQVSILRDEIELVRDVARRIAVIEHQLTEMTKTKELWGQRGWMVLTICLSASFSFVAVILGGLLTYYLNTKK